LYNRFQQEVKRDQKEFMLESGRTGELLAVADPSSWFSYYYWLDDARAPDFAYCVAIHRKPGYDPTEMFFRFPLPWGKLYLFWKLFLVYVLRVRTCVDASPVHCSDDTIKGSHGALGRRDDHKPIIICRDFPANLDRERINATDVYSVLLHNCR